MAAQRLQQLYVVRHGKAEDDHPGGDSARALTPAGREQFKAHADHLSNRVRVTGIVTSPLVRAVQTAELLAASWGTSSVVVRNELSFETASPTTLAALIGEMGPGWAFVGHNPSLAETLQEMLGLDDTPRLRKGAVAALLRSKAGWQLDWVAAPGRKLERAFE
jgi:phosphohistidine phosphatase